MLSKRTLRYFIVFGITFYILLCVLHFASGRPLWLDENSLLDNLKTLSPHQIFGPLKHEQGFPRLYLAGVQALSGPFDYSVYSLRVLPLLFMLSAFFLWLRIYKKEEGTGIGYLVFILSWCGSHFMTYYSAELKQYSADVFVAALFTIFILDQRDLLKRRKLDPLLTAKCLFLPALISISYAGYFFVLLPLYNFLLGAKDNRRNAFYACIYLISVLLFVSVSYGFDVKYTQAAAGMRAYWNDYYISISSFPAFLQSLSEGFRNLFARWFLEVKLVRRIMTIFLPFAVYAIISLGTGQIKKDRGLILSLRTITPFLIIALALAGILKIYPFTGARVTIFIAGFIFYAIIKGIEIFKERFFRVYVALLSVYVITLCSTSLYLLRRYLIML